MADVLGGRATNNEENKQAEEQKEALQIDPAELNDISQGEFRIETMRMKDAEQGTVLWQSSNWDLASQEEQKVEFPAAMLGCKAIGREMVFYSKKLMHQFSIRQVMSM